MKDSMTSFCMQNFPHPNKTRYFGSVRVDVTAAVMKCVVWELYKLTVFKYRSRDAENLGLLSCCWLGVAHINLSRVRI